jgi:hypothetical protein
MTASSEEESEPSEAAVEGKTGAERRVGDAEGDTGREEFAGELGAGAREIIVLATVGTMLLRAWVS